MKVVRLAARLDFNLKSYVVYICRDKLRSTLDRLLGEEP
jgi:hypothetical protein